MVIRSEEMDPSFIEEIEKLGGESVRKCYQCASCTATCPLTSDIKAFPRRTIRLVQLGLRERAVRSPDIWLCSACATCKASCPREANPGEVMAALRRYAYSRFSWLPSLSKHLTSSPKIVVPAMGLVGAILVALMFSVGNVSNLASAVSFLAFLPSNLVDIAGMMLGVATAFGIGMNSLKLWKTVARPLGDPPEITIRQRFRNLLDVVVQEVALQRTIRKCNTGRLQWLAHLSLIAGFAGAGVTTTLVFLFNAGMPFQLDSPVKILGNLSAGLLLFGSAALIGKRIFQKPTIGETLFQDGLFISMLFVVALTGTLAEVFRLVNTSMLAYPTYSIHLVSVLLLLGLAPYTKFAHAIYRPLAMYAAKLTGWPN